MSVKNNKQLAEWYSGSQSSLYPSCDKSNKSISKNTNSKNSSRSMSIMSKKSARKNEQLADWYAESQKSSSFSSYNNGYSNPLSPSCHSTSFKSASSPGNPLHTDNDYSCNLQQQQQQQQRSTSSSSSSVILSSRWIHWTALSASSIISVSSIAIAVPHNDRTSIDIAALALSSISSIISATVAASFLYGPSRALLTSDNYEFTTSLFLLAIWSAELWLIMNATHELGMQGLEVWGTNLFFAAWIAFSTAVYLVADLLTIDDRSGLLPWQYTPNNTIRKGWIYILVVSIVLMATALTTASGAGGMLLCEEGEIVNCEYIYITVALAGMGIVISVFSFFLYRQWQLNKLNDASLARYGAVLAFSSLLTSTVNIPVTTANNSVGSLSGSIFFLCWAFFWLSLYMCLRYIDVFGMFDMKSSSDNESVGHMTGSVTASSKGSSFYSDDEGDELDDPDSVLGRTTSSGVTIYLDNDGGSESMEAASKLSDDQALLLLNNNAAQSQTTKESTSTKSKRGKSRSKSPSSNNNKKNVQQELPMVNPFHANAQTTSSAFHVVVPPRDDLNRINNSNASAAAPKKSRSSSSKKKKSSRHNHHHHHQEQQQHNNNIISNKGGGQEPMGLVLPATATGTTHKQHSSKTTTKIKSSRSKSSRSKASSTPSDPLPVVFEQSNESSLEVSPTTNSLHGGRYNGSSSNNRKNGSDLQQQQQAHHRSSRHGSKSPSRPRSSSSSRAGRTMQAPASPVSQIHSNFMDPSLCNSGPPTISP